jgi:hypothetical protein
MKSIRFTPGNPLAVRLLVVAGLMLFSGMGQAAQIVALDLQATNVKKGVKAAVQTMLLTELSRHQGISVVSESDVRALLEHEANRQALGCDDAGCMADIASSLGAELLLKSTLSRAGGAWVVGLTLIRTDTATAFRRASGTQKGGLDMAKEAVIQAVGGLFRQGLPNDLQGPRSMSRRGFRAAMLGFGKLLLRRGEDPKPARRRLISDIVNTELDYDANPKIEALDLAARRGMSKISALMLGSKNAADLQFYLGARGQWIAVREDLMRVKEIRERARAQGMTPSTRPLRFEDPDPLDPPDPKVVADYQRRHREVKDVVARALRAYQRNNVRAFQAEWVKGYAGNAERELRDGKNSDKRYGYTYSLLPLYAMPPWFYDHMDDVLKKGEMIVFLRQDRKGEPYDEARVYLKKEDGRWKIRGW